MKKMIAMLLVGGALAFCTVGCGPAASSSGTTTVKTDKDKTTVDIKDKPKTDVKVGGDKDVEIKKDTKDAPKPDAPKP